MISLDEQIAFQSATYSYTGRPEDAAILATLQSIKSQPVPVEPVCVKKMRRLKNDPTWEVEWMTLGYIDSLQSALKVAQEELKTARHTGGGEKVVEAYKERAEQAEQERDKLKPYWLAIDHRMVVLHLGTADSFDADTCMNKILEWETEIALDPQVSRPAQELKDTHLQRAEKAVASNKRLTEYATHLPECDANSKGLNGDCDCGLAELLREVGNG